MVAAGGDAGLLLVLVSSVGLVGRGTAKKGKRNGLRRSGTDRMFLRFLCGGFGGGGAGSFGRANSGGGDGDGEAAGVGGTIAGGVGWIEAAGRRLFAAGRIRAVCGFTDGLAIGGVAGFGRGNEGRGTGYGGRNSGGDGGVEGRVGVYVRDRRGRDVLGDWRAGGGLFD